MDSVFERRDLIDRVYETLQRDYVSLLGQRGSGLETFLKMLVKGSLPSAAMKFISITIPEGIPDEEGPFNEILLDRLLEAICELPSGKMLRTEIEQKIALYNNAQVRLLFAIETLGRRTEARPLVIVLQAVSFAPKNSLRNFLLMLRDYHRQIDLEGAAGEHLRFLVAGDLRLWLLSMHSEDSLNISAFDIAKRIFLTGLSYREIAAFDVFADIEYAIYAKNLTDGIPSLVHKVSKLRRSSNTLSPFFGFLESSWNWLPGASKQALKMLAENLGNTPLYNLDYECPAIPKLETPWLEAFWKGFLKVHLRELTWRSPIHQAFVMHNTKLEGDISKAAMMRRNQLEGLRRFTKLLRRICEDESVEEYLEEALLLTLPTKGALLAPLLKQLCLGAEKSEIMQQVREVIANIDKGWLKELAGHIEEESFVEFLVATSLWEARRLLGDFDVFLYYHDEDMFSVKAIAEQLLEHGILPWLDVWELPPGDHVRLQQIKYIKAVAILFGKNDIGPGKSEEVNTFLSSHEQDCSIIHVILADAPQAMVQQSASFSTKKEWIDFREPNSLSIQQLVLAVARKQALTKIANPSIERKGERNMASLNPEGKNEPSEEAQSPLQPAQAPAVLPTSAQLREAMKSAYNFGGLELLCADLNIHYGDLGEGAIEVKIQHLIDYCLQQRGDEGYDKLVQKVLEGRPHLRQRLGMPVQKPARANTSLHQASSASSSSPSSTSLPQSATRVTNTPGFEHGYALIIGINRYQNQNLGKLSNAILKDAFNIQTILQSADYCGYARDHVRVLLNDEATADGIREGLRWLARSASSGSTALVYFSGHGGRIEIDSQANHYLIPYNCDLADLDGTAISNQELTQLLHDIHASKFLALLDSCYSGGAAQAQGLKAGEKASEEVYYNELAHRQLDQGRGRIIIASSRSEEASHVLAEMDNSLFTHYLLEALQGKARTRGDGFIRVLDVYEHVAEKVPEHLLQHPIFQATNADNFPIALYLGGKQTANAPLEVEEKPIPPLYICEHSNKPAKCRLWNQHPSGFFAVDAFPVTQYTPCPHCGHSGPGTLKQVN